jgi:hypothetical protein
MTDDARLQAAADRIEIIQVSTLAMICRDTADWGRLPQCFHPDARLTVSWFDGTAREFAEQSKNMVAGHEPGDTQRHMMSNPHVTLNGRRAINEFYLVLHQGRTLDGYEFDFQTWSVTLDLCEKRDGEWRISRRMMIYEKGRMDPRTPGSVPQSYYDGLDLSQFPAPIKYHCYRNFRSSGHVPKNLIMKGSPEEKAARQSALEWLMAPAAREG